MGEMKNRALVDWMKKQGFVKGREWATQRLPKSLITVIRQMAERRDLSPAQMIEIAFRGNPDLARDFELTLHPWAGLVDLVGQQTLKLD